jgi:hypothetical protein
VRVASLVAAAALLAACNGTPAPRTVTVQGAPVPTAGVSTVEQALGLGGETDPVRR